MEVEITSSGEWLWAEYDSMSVESEADNYRLHVTGYDGNAGDAFNHDNSNWRSNGMHFSTPDRDNDEWANENCAGSIAGGWWFSYCSISQLNGMSSRFWHSTASGAVRPVSASRMMLQCDA